MFQNQVINAFFLIGLKTQATRTHLSAQCLQSIAKVHYFLSPFCRKFPLKNKSDSVEFSFEVSVCSSSPGKVFVGFQLRMSSNVTMDAKVKC